MKMRTRNSKDFGMGISEGQAAARSGIEAANLGLYMKGLGEWTGLSK